MKKVLVLVTMVLISFSLQVSAKDPKVSNRSSEQTQHSGSAGAGQRVVYPLNNLIPFMPKDVVYSTSDHRGWFCDQNANHLSKPGFSCREVHSRSTGQNFLLRFSGKEGDRVFLVSNGTPSLYVQMGAGSDVNRVIHKSQEAEQVAAANGYQFDSRSSTMIAAGSGGGSSPPVAVATQQGGQTSPSAIGDCSSPQAEQNPICAIKKGGAAIGGLFGRIPK